MQRPLHEPCNTRSFQMGRGVQKVTCKLTRKPGTCLTLQIMILWLNFKQLLLLSSVLPHEQLGFVGSCWDPVLIFPFSNFTFLIYKSRNGPKTVILKGLVKFDYHSKPQILARSQLLCLPLWAQIPPTVVHAFNYSLGIAHPFYMVENQAHALAR